MFRGGLCFQALLRVVWMVLGVSTIFHRTDCWVIRELMFLQNIADPGMHFSILEGLRRNMVFVLSGVIG